MPAAVGVVRPRHTERATMAVEPLQREKSSTEPARVAASALAAFATASRALAEAGTLEDALEALVEAAAQVTGSALVLARIQDPAEGQVRARVVWAGSPALAASVEGSGFPTAELPAHETTDLAAAPDAVRHTADRAGARAVLLVPVVLAERRVGSLELFRARDAFTEREAEFARLVAVQIGLAVRAFGEEPGEGGAETDALERAGDALAAGADEARAAQSVVTVAAQTAGAAGALLWRSGEDGTLRLVSSSPPLDDADLSAAEEAALAALAAPEPITVERDRPGLPAGARVAATIQLGQPPIGALQLLFPAGAAPTAATLSRLARFGARSAHALRASERARSVALELERTRALLAVVGQAIAHLSLSHTLATAVERVAELVEAERLAVYLLEDGRLTAAAGLGLAGPHVRVAERILELALGPLRGRAVIALEGPEADARLAPVQDALAESGIDAVIAVPLLVHEEAIGLLAVYPPVGRTVTQSESALLASLAAQLAVAVQNARLHERAVRAESEAKQALASEKHAASRLRALYDISHSFTQSLSLARTLDALARAAVELLGVDAAVIRMPDERRDDLVVRTIHVRDPRLREPVEAIVSRPQTLSRLPGRRLFRMGKALVLDPTTAAAMGASYELLVPFLEKGSTAAVVPIKTPSEVLATLTLLSLDPGKAITDETVDAALAVAGQAALAIDNARLYEQQRDFADTIQRSLLPRSEPALAGLELGAVYESAAHVEVGGDLYDFLELADGRLAVVLGDVTGHGIDATADMAMAKFVFRSLAREHPEPTDFLAHANEVVVGEIAQGKFITMLYLTVDVQRGEVACAGAGHPPPRVIDRAGEVHALDARGLALGIEADQRYEEAREPLVPGATVVLYTDGVVEARNRSELFGVERLDEVLVRKRGLPAKDLAEAVLAECRAFAGGELADDCAVVVIKRTA
jgi:serine phosphatase RsbU (regulator of sigma subunit)